MHSSNYLWTIDLLNLCCLLQLFTAGNSFSLTFESWCFSMELVTTVYSLSWSPTFTMSGQHTQLRLLLGIPQLSWCCYYYFWCASQELLTPGRGRPARQVCLLVRGSWIPWRTLAYSAPWSGCQWRSHDWLSWPSRWWTLIGLLWSSSKKGRKRASPIDETDLVNSYFFFYLIYNYTLIDHLFTY